MHLLFRWLTGLTLGLALNTLLGSAAAQVAPARYLLTGKLAGEPVQLELTLSPTRVTGKLLGTPPRNLSGKQTQAGDVHLQGAGLNLTGRLPERFSKPGHFPGRHGTERFLT